MIIAGGMLGWTEAEFWSSTLPYFRASVEGLNQFHGGANNEGPSDEDIAAAIEQATREGLM